MGEHASTSPEGQAGAHHTAIQKPTLTQNLDKVISDATDPLGATPVPLTKPATLGPKWERRAATPKPHAEPVAEPAAQTPAPEGEDDHPMQPVRRTREGAEQPGSPPEPKRAKPPADDDDNIFRIANQTPPCRGRRGQSADRDLVAHQRPRRQSPQPRSNKCY